MKNRSGMSLKIALMALAAACVLAAAGVSWALDGKSVARLKKAGVSDRTLELMVKERTVETAAFTVDEIIAMKAAGIGEDALQTLISEGSFLKDREPVIYGNDLRSIRLTTVADIIALKKAGVSDEVLRAIVAASRPDSDLDREEAMQLLRETGVWVEQRR
ncbi:MAG: hypothetical protein ACM3KE_17190 [Hyphomicrobiales bacterium]